jgi:hypothetical protein
LGSSVKGFMLAPSNKPWRLGLIWCRNLALGCKPPI